MNVCIGPYHEKVRFYGKDCPLCRVEPLLMAYLKAGQISRMRYAQLVGIDLCDVDAAVRLSHIGERGGSHE